MSISFTGINEQVITFKTETELEAGTLVKISANGTVSACAANDKIAGVVLFCRDKLAAVQVSGFAALPYTGTAPTLGYAKLCAASATQIKADSTNGRELMVLEADTNEKIAGFML